MPQITKDETSEVFWLLLDGIQLELTHLIERNHRLISEHRLVNKLTDQQKLLAAYINDHPDILVLMLMRTQHIDLKTMIDYCAEAGLGVGMIDGKLWKDG